MRLHLKDKLTRFLIVLIISLLFVSFYLTAALSFELNPLLGLFVWLVTIGFLYVFCVLRPELILFEGLPIRAPSSETLHTMRSTWQKLGGPDHETLDVQIVDVSNFSACFYATQDTCVLVIGSETFNELNLIDLEALFSYLIESISVSNPARDTMILLLASLLRRGIITSFLGAALVHLVRPSVDDRKLDEQASMRMKHAMGYRKMLERLAQLESHMINEKGISAAWSMNSIQNLRARSEKPIDTWFHVHEAIGGRIAALLQSERSALLQ